MWEKNLQNLLPAVFPVERHVRPLTFIHQHKWRVNLKSWNLSFPWIWYISAHQNLSLSSVRATTNMIWMVILKILMLNRYLCWVISMTLKTTVCFFIEPRLSKAPSAHSVSEKETFPYKRTTCLEGTWEGCLKGVTFKSICDRPGKYFNGLHSRLTVLNLLADSC